MPEQNIFDDQTFFSEYQKLRDNKANYNNLIEQPAMKKLMPDIAGKSVLDLGCGCGPNCAGFVKNGTESDRLRLLSKYPNLDKFFFGNGRLVIAENGNEIVGFLWAHKRKISAPVEAEEMFINYITVFEPELHCRGIGTQMIQRIIEIARAEQVYQIRAKVKTENVPSHRLWLKNKFSISPAQMPNGNIAVSFVGYVL